MSDYLARGLEQRIADVKKANGLALETIMRLLAQIQDADPRGDRFRYPLDIKGKPFEPKWVEIEGLMVNGSPGGPADRGSTDPA
jgi:hypothetical protein